MLAIKKIPNDKTLEWKHKLVSGSAFYTKGTSGSDFCSILAKYPDWTYIDSYDDLLLRVINLN